MVELVLLLAGCFIGIGFTLIGILMENLVTQVVALIAAIDRAIPLLATAASNKQELDALKASAQSLADQVSVKLAELNAALPPQ